MVEAGPSHGKEFFGISHKHPRKFYYSLTKGCCCQEVCQSDEIVAPICDRLAFDCARIAHNNWLDGLRDAEFVKLLISHRTIDEVAHNTDVFQSNISTTGSTSAIPLCQDMILAEKKVKGYGELMSLLSIWAPTSSTTLNAIVLQHRSDTITYLHIPFMESFIHAVFDPHARHTHTPGPSFTLSSQIDDITALQSFAGSLTIDQGISARLLRSCPTEPRVICGDVFDLLPDTSSHSAQTHLGKDTKPQICTRSYDALKPVHRDDIDIAWPSGLDSGPLFACNFSSSVTFPRSKQKQKCSSPLSHCASPSLPWEIGRTSYEQLTPYPSAENLLKRPSSAPECEEGPPLAGPSRLSWRELQSKAGSPENEEPSEERGNSLNNQGHTLQQTSSDDGWLFDLVYQLQEEEEITASLGYQVPCENAWLVALQKRVLVEENLESSSPLTSSELDWHLAAQLQAGLGSLRKTAISPVQEAINNNSRNILDCDSTFECGICNDRQDNSVNISLDVCGHTYCRDCVTSLVKAKVDDNRYPIICPECLIDRSRADKRQITEDILNQLNLSQRDVERLRLLQLRVHSVILECPKCLKSVNIDRAEYVELRNVLCSSAECGFIWCKNCLKGLKSLDDRHRCKNESIDRLMRRRGWKYCPGCRTPVQKESGCNHMTCGAPGCNAHFCYKCGDLIVDTTLGGDVGLTVTDHYANSKCRLFERRFYCTIQ